MIRRGTDANINRASPIRKDLFSSRNVPFTHDSSYICVDTVPYTCWRIQSKRILKRTATLEGIEDGGRGRKEQKEEALPKGTLSDANPEPSEMFRFDEANSYALLPLLRQSVSVFPRFSSLPPSSSRSSRFSASQRSRTEPVAHLLAGCNDKFFN
ncbi:hypothetical protein Trydic_g3792 [Trypoxylus dichotomus]